MTNSTFLFQIPPDLQEYAVPDHEFLRQHPEYDTLCTGVVVFDKEGKMLLVQRAKSEKAFPNAWVRQTAFTVIARAFGTHCPPTISRSVWHGL